MPRADWRTVSRLAFRHLVVRRGRALVLLVGYSLGAAVMMVLLSVGSAMLTQSRDVSLVGGGDVTVLPEGIDLEGLRTGSVAGMFFGIDRARFLTRQLIGGPRSERTVAAMSPVIEHKLLYLVPPQGGEPIPIRAGGEIPSRARMVGAGLNLLRGRWEDSRADSVFVAPNAQQLYDELDRFHPPADDSTWAEWHYFNLAISADEWWYLTYMIGGRLSRGDGGGQLLVTRHRAGTAPARFSSSVPRTEVVFDTARADLSIGPHSVVQRNGRYRIVGSAVGIAGPIRFDLELVPQANAYFPPVELRNDRFLSGYVVPGLRALARGTLCEAGRCREFRDVPAYHDHNWGVWRETTWNWGQARGTSMSVVYGGVVSGDSMASRSNGRPYFVAAVDSLGVRQILRFDRIRYLGAKEVEGWRGLTAPERFRIEADRDQDSLAIDVVVRRAQASAAGVLGLGRAFLQMRGEFKLVGRLLGAAVADSGLGFFETFVDLPRGSSAPR